MTAELQEYLGKAVVIDTKSYYVYIGTFVGEGEQFITLQDVDVHDQRESSACKELYILETLKYGIRANRREAKIVRQEIASISLLSDVVNY